MEGANREKGSISIYYKQYKIKSRANTKHWIYQEGVRYPGVERIPYCNQKMFRNEGIYMEL